MRSTFLSRLLAVLFLCWGCTSEVHASHILGADLTYEYVGTINNPNQYHVTARLFQDLNSTVNTNQVMLTCGREECGTALPDSFTATLNQTSAVTSPTYCSTGNYIYRITILEGYVSLPPAHWTLSINLENRTAGVLNIAQSENVTLYVKALLDNTTPPGSPSLRVVNSSPQFTTDRLIQLSNGQAQQRYSLGAFDSEGDSLVYQLVQPLAAPTPASPCGVLTVGSMAPHFQLNAATGQLLTVVGPTQLGRYALAGRVDEYRRINGTWRQIGSITRDMTYLVQLYNNQLPTFTRVASTGNPTGQLLNQTIRANPGQTLSLTLTATDPDAGQYLVLTSNLASIVPGATFQNLGNGQGRLTWQVPATQSLGRYVLTATVIDNACPVPGAEVLTVPVLVTSQALATHPDRQPLAQLPFPMPFQEEVQFQLAGQGRQPVVISDELGQTVAQLLSAADGRIVWRPAAAVSAGLYLARNLAGTQVARLSYTGH